MTRLATKEDFHGGHLYTDYRRYPFFAQRAEVIRERFPNAQRVLIAGCGYGYLVDELRQRGVEAWGCDASPWATGQAAQAIPRNARFIRHGDVTDAQSMVDIMDAAGLRQNDRFDLAVTEDLLPVLDHEEIAAAVGILAATAWQMLHIITPGDPDDPAKTAPLNWKPIEAWRDLCAPDPVLDAETGVIV